LPSWFSRRRVAVLLVLLLLGAVLWQLQYVVGPRGAGFHAKVLCSGVFVAGRSPASLRGGELDRFWYIQGEVDRERRTATSSVFGFAPTTAVHREGLGCTLAIGRSVAELREDPPPVYDPKPAPPLPVADDLDGDVRRSLKEALDAAFAEPDPARRRNTRAVVVLHRGRIVAERYAEGFDRTTPQAGWSMTKSITGTLVGIAAHRGHLDPADPAPVPEWRGQNDPRGTITVQHLLRMSSGLAFDETYSAFGDVTYMLFAVPSTGRYAARFPRVHPPGRRWSYSSGTTNILSRALKHRLGSDTYHRFPHEALFEPIGMTRAVIEPDPSGTYVGSSFMYATAREWARFGQLYLQGGSWRGRRVVPADWVDYARTPAPADERGRFGAHWWLNRGPADTPSERPFPSLPRDLYRASGFEGQQVMVIPSRDAVVVRLGMTPDEAALDLDDTVSRILDALPPERDPTDEKPATRTAAPPAGDARAPS